MNSKRLITMLLAVMMSLAVLVMPVSAHEVRSVEIEADKDMTVVVNGIRIPVMTDKVILREVYNNGLDAVAFNAGNPFFHWIYAPHSGNQTYCFWYTLMVVDTGSGGHTEDIWQTHGWTTTSPIKCWKYNDPTDPCNTLKK